jgi:hypothetical protein
METNNLIQAIESLKALVAELDAERAARQADAERARREQFRDAVRKPYGTHWLDLDQVDPADLQRWYSQVDRATRRRRAA